MAELSTKIKCQLEKCYWHSQNGYDQPSTKKSAIQLGLDPRAELLKDTAAFGPGEKVAKMLTVIVC